MSISKDCLFVYTYHIGDNIKEPYNQFHFIKEISEIAPDLQTFIYTSNDNIILKFELLSFSIIKC